MKNPPKKNNTIPGEFTAIPDSLLGVGFDIYEIIIISSVQSWTRQNKKFYESKGRIADEYGCSRATISRKFDKLKKSGILIEGKKHGKGQYEYSVNVNKLLQIINEHKVTCNRELQQTAFDVTESYTSCNRELQNKTTKTINKNSFREEESKNDSSSKPEEPQKPVIPENWLDLVNIK
jgi:biotin operon repressor